MRRCLILCLLLTASLCGQTIAEKKKGLARGFTDLDPRTEQSLIKINDELARKKNYLRDLYLDVSKLQEYNAPEECYSELLETINAVKAEIEAIDREWQEIASGSGRGDLYALWHQPDSTIEQLVIDYGSQDFVYTIPPEIGGIKVSVNSSIPIPRASWETMLEIILNQNGVGIRELNPFLRELYSLTDLSQPVQMVTDNPGDLEYLAPRDRVAFILRPSPTEVRRVWGFLNKFINPRTTTLQQVGREIFIVSQASEIQDLLRIYSFTATDECQTQYKLIPLRKIKAQEMAKAISAMFEHMSDQPVFVSDGSEGVQIQQGGETTANGLKIIILDSISQAIFLVGTQEEIDMAEKMIKKIESQIGGGREMVVHWYSVKHSIAQNLANTLQEVYSAMIRSGIRGPNGGGIQPDGAVNQSQEVGEVVQNVTVEDPRDNYPFSLFDDAYYLPDDQIVDPLLEMQAEEMAEKRRNPNFIVDDKTGSLILVVEKGLLDRMLEIIARLDVPKKMVQIDILLFEKRCRERTDYGLNLLKVGGCASNTRNTCIKWDEMTPPLGLFEFLMSRPVSENFPAFDFIYKFLLTQENISLNSNPSVVTLNQTPAEINILEERSISTGTSFIATTNATTPKENFVRAKYGISIKVTPTIHEWSEESGDPDGVDFITLDTYVNFDTIERSFENLIEDRPNVIRRTIRNEVLIGDGQTIVMGGLRRKDARDGKQTIPFFGEIPGFGKLFSMTEMEDETTEMLIFMTPKIIHDPCEDIERIKFEKLCQRPGDIPAFLMRLNESRECFKQRAFQQTVRILLGRGPNGYFPSQIGCVPASMNRNPEGCACLSGDYDGR